MKKVLSIMLTALCLFVFASCGEEPPAPPIQPTEPPATAIYLTVWYYEYKTNKELLPSVVVKLTEGEPYDADELTSKEVEGYTIKELSDSATGTARDNVNITVYYEKVTETPPDAEQHIPTVPEYAVSDDVVADMRGLVNSYLPIAEAFTSGGELSATVRLYVACKSLAHSFEEIEDPESEFGFSYSISLDVVRAEVVRMFGSLAGLPQVFEIDRDSGYTVDFTNNTVKTMTPGELAESFFFNFAVVALNDGSYEFWVMDLGKDYYDALVLQGIDPATHNPAWEDVPHGGAYAQCQIYVMRYSQTGSLYIESMHLRL